MTPTENDKQAYIERLQRFHERPHGKQLDDLVVEYLQERQATDLPERRKNLRDRFDYRPRNNMLMLEVGCGVGTLARRVVEEVSSVRYIATDPNYWVDADRLNGHQNIIYRRKPLFEHARYNAVVCMNVLGHMEDPESMLLSMAGVLQRDGVLIVSIPSRLYEQAMWAKNLFTGYRSDPTLLHRWYDWQLVGLLERIGLQLIAKHDVATHGPLCESTLFVFRK